jgi:hypothetical protein
MDDVKLLTQKLNFLKQEIGKLGGVRLTSSSAKWSIIQGVLSSGDRRLSNILYDMEIKNLSWDRAFKENNINQEFYVKRHRRFDEIFPWDQITPSVPKERLLERLVFTVPPGYIRGEK